MQWHRDELFFFPRWNATPVQASNVGDNAELVAQLGNLLLHEMWRLGRSRNTGLVKIKEHACQDLAWL